MAGAVTALAFYLVLTMIGVALGLTIGPSVSLETMSLGAAIWAVVAVCLSMLVGGFVTTQLTAGETNAESLVHGVILWGAVVGIMLWLSASGVQGGFNAMLSIAYAGSNQDNFRDNTWEAAARRAGISQTRIDELKQTARQAVERPDTAEAQETRDKIRRNAAMVSWWALFGTLLSMGAAICGSWLGAGPTVRRMVWPRTPHRVERREYANQV
jgi:predicted anti-sigma-YlaC factor YlaD